MHQETEDKFITTTKYFTDIEGAMAYNSSSTDGYAKKKLKLVLNALIKGKSIFIEDISLELKSIEEYKLWKKDRALLNVYNSENLIEEIKYCESKNLKW